jgi:hypothetical protein
MCDTHEPPKGSGLFLETSYHTVNPQHAQAEKFPDVFEISLRPSAYRCDLCVEIPVNAKYAEIRGAAEKFPLSSLRRTAAREFDRNSKKIVCRLRATILDHLALLFV